ncbi:helix-turn-helix transcriptional regulator [Leekyejoonella antrihumi]|uniref:Helix-turn-helix transcriptional regulator n=1 Tax=Leekyejoonella antrihumi TaxID=1660198 RepID=A0A563DUM9_9MICO|nr:helix-turn-helix transcriptional regulator [Leekyejoonella antrihumi]TWP33886.1 helix-turn-helix transcriptional regulator [Leekyejoonella antrihumi]
MDDETTTDSRGPLYPARLPTFHRIPPPATVASLVRWFWIPEWHLAPGRTSRQHLISYPACNVVVEPDLVGISGPTTRASHRDLDGDGWAVGALLHPAAVRAFVDDPATVRDAYVPLDLPDLQGRVVACMQGAESGEERRAAAVDAFTDWLVESVPPPGGEALLANRMAQVIDGDVEMLRVGEVADEVGVSVRTLQRLARRYVGVTPAAMIRRRRLQEAAARLRAEPDTDLAGLAAELGYADQAHLAGEFRRALDFTPSSYRRAPG